MIVLKRTYRHDGDYFVYSIVMTIKRKANELLVSVSTNGELTKVQAVLDYLRYEELTSACDVNEELAQQMAKEAKKGRWEKTKKRLAIDD